MTAVGLERGSGPLFRINPVAKILAVLPLTVCLLLTLDWVSAAVAIAGEVLIFLTVGLTARRYWLRTVPVWLAAPVAGASIVLYGQASGTIYWTFGLATVSSGSLQLGVATFARVVALALPAVVIFLTTDPTDLADGLAQVLRLPSRFVLGALAGLRMVGLFVEDWRALELGRRARGVADRGRLRRLLGQALALLVLSIRRGSKLATAMEARGFGGPARRTWARQSTFGAVEWASIGLGVVLAAAVVAAALAAGTWNLVF